MLEGTYEFRAGEESIRAGAGECVHIPRPLPHAFFNVGQTPGRLLVVVSPGGLHETYFDEAWESADSVRDLPADAAPADFERVARALEKAGMRMLEAPVSA